MVDYTKIYAVIENLVGQGEPLFQHEVVKKLEKYDKAIISGYLRCLVDLGRIQSKKKGNSIIYYKEVKKK